MIKKKTAIKRFDATMKGKIKKLLETIGNDGHTVWKPAILEGFPKAIKDRFVTTIKSDGSYKGSIWNNGKMVEEMQGIYGLALLGNICSDLNLESESKLGRGFQAVAYTESINKWLLEEVSEPRRASEAAVG